MLLLGRRSRIRLGNAAFPSKKAAVDAMGGLDYTYPVNTREFVSKMSIVRMKPECQWPAPTGESLEQRVE